MKTTPDELTIVDVLDLKTQQMLVVNPEYQRGAVWTPTQKKKLIDSVLRGYTRSWEAELASAFDQFRDNLAKAKQTRYDAAPSEYWLSYGVGTRVNSDRREVLQRRHEFFAEKMHAILDPQTKDPQRAFGILERELIYYRFKKRCAVCNAEVIWAEAEIHHVDQHSKGGKTTIDNGALVHRHCHPKGSVAETAFAEKWKTTKSIDSSKPSKQELQAAAEEADENGNGV